MISADFGLIFAFALNHCWQNYIRLFKNKTKFFLIKVFFPREGGGGLDVNPLPMNWIKTGLMLSEISLRSLIFFQAMICFQIWHWTPHFFPPFTYHSHLVLFQHSQCDQNQIPIHFINHHTVFSFLRNFSSKFVFICFLILAEAFVQSIVNFRIFYCRGSNFAWEFLLKC